MKLIYIIAPYRSPLINGVHRNIQAAEYAAIQLWKAGYAVICCHKNSAYFDGIVPDTAFLEGGIEILRRCDCAVIIGDIRKSEGSQNEVKFASGAMPIYHSLAAAIEAVK